MVKPIEPATPIGVLPRYFHWTPVILGALVATALSSILLAFGATVGLGISSAAPTWRDASAALWILSGLYLIIQAALSFGLGGYIAGRTSRWPSWAGCMGARGGAGRSPCGAAWKRDPVAIERRLGRRTNQR